VSDKISKWLADRVTLERFVLFCTLLLTLGGAAMNERQQGKEIDAGKAYDTTQDVRIDSIKDAVWEIRGDMKVVLERTGGQRPTTSRTP
jgi:hypothetical protein